jgi:3-deoxy-D-manno-octulosonic-acid transferase
VTFLYRCLTYLYAVPVTIAIFIVRLIGKREQFERLGLGLTPINNTQRPFWFVASSVGEVVIAIKMIQRLKESTNAPVLLTVTTSTGRGRAGQSDCRADVVAFHPLDLPSSVRRFLNAYNPGKIILVETELWPSLMTEAFGRGVGVIQVSGRISEKSLRRYRPFIPLFRPLLKRCDALLMQSEDDAQRLREMAGPDAHIQVVGSPKGEYVAPGAGELAKIDTVLEPWKNTRIIVCGSTRPGEEDILLDAFAGIIQQLPQSRLVLAPRHLERVSEVAALIKQSGLTSCLRSQSSLSAQTQVLLLDTIGELNLMYHHAAIAFVGGTLVPLGGHNLLEPALAGYPVLYGPHYFNQRVGQESLDRFQMGRLVSTASEFEQTTLSLLNDPQTKSIYATRAVNLRHESATVIDRYVTAILG